MKEFNEKVAVITGGASGIGRAMAERFAHAGMRIVLADVEEAALSQTAAEMTDAGATVLPVMTDVAKADQVDALAQQTLDAFGAVHLLCNNAGVGAGTTIWESTLADWEWVLGVNLWGVIHGVRTFTPIMLAQANATGDECHIVNTASIAGLIAGPMLGAYKVSKFGVVSLSETLYYELGQQTDKIGVSVLCPEWVNTKVSDSSRNRPASLQNEPAAVDDASPDTQLAGDVITQLIANGMAPADVAAQVFHAVENRELYILTHPHTRAMVQDRVEHIVAARNPPLGQGMLG